MFQLDRTRKSNLVEPMQKAPRTSAQAVGLARIDTARRPEAAARRDHAQPTRNCAATNNTTHNDVSKRIRID